MANEYGDSMDSGANDDTRWRFGGCVVRLGESGPYIHADGQHISIGATSVEIDSNGYLLINTDGHIAPICWAMAVPDETLARDVVITGPSWAANTTRIGFAKAGSALDLSDPSDYAEVSGSNTNIWVSWAAPVYRGVGEPSLAQQALDLINNNILPRLAALESVQS